MGDLWGLKGLIEEENETPGWTHLKLPGQAPSPRCGHTVTSEGHYARMKELLVVLGTLLQGETGEGDQRVKKMTTQIADLEEKCRGFEALKVEVSLMKKMFSQMSPLFTFTQDGDDDVVDVHSPCDVDLSSCDRH
uniref:Uncharacterized protein n=1 Tax=Quercus lobata TaxID=97700 RepID=A0A7N2KWA7_QUELO